MKTRNEIYGGTFSSPEAPDTNANGELKKLVLSDNADITKNRSSWIRTIFYNIMDSFTHKTEDRATSANLGVSGAEPITTKYVTVEQLPFVDKTTNNFTGSAGGGSLITTQNTINISTVLTGTAKQFVASLHTDFVAWLLARTWLQSELEDLITDTATPLIDDAIADIPYTAPLTYPVTAGSEYTVISETYADVPSASFTNLFANVYLVNVIYSLYQRADFNETRSITVKVYNSVTNVIYDESIYTLGNSNAGIVTGTSKGSFSGIMTLADSDVVKVAIKGGTAYGGGGANPSKISNIRMSFLQIK